MELPSALSGLSPQNVSLKNFFFFFLKYPALKNSFVFSLKNFSNFQETVLSYIFFKKVFLIFREKFIQNPSMFITRSIFKTLVYSEPSSIFRTRGIFRTLVYLDPGVYSEYCQTSFFYMFLIIHIYNDNKIVLVILVIWEPPAASRPLKRKKKLNGSKKATSK